MERGTPILVTAICILGLSYGSEDPIVQTEYGKVRGTSRQAIGSHRPVYSYFGVQYGRSPDYVFRFRPSEDPWSWDDIRDATAESRPQCVQDPARYEKLQQQTFLRHIMPELNMQENCLTMDIFSPKNPNSDSKDLLPVILWIHGGSLDAFCSSTKLWALSAFEDVVLVQIQYRLGLFGFFTTEDAWAPPNSAFHDHLKAMRWVQRNIRAFGGDPNLVTLMGQSAGAVAVTAHTLMPAGNGLFHRVFAMSGGPDTMVWQPTYGDAVQRIAEKTNCKFDDNAATSTCLRNKVKTSRLMNLSKELDIHFKLLEDRTLLPGPVRNLVESKSFASAVPLLIGVTNGEQNFLLPRRVFSDVYFKGGATIRSEVEQALRRFLSSRYPQNKVNGIAKLVIKEYADPSKVGNVGMDMFKGVLDAIADCWFVSKTARYAQKMKEAGQSVYFYEFALKPSMYDAKPDEFVRPHNFTTADHADDVLYAFGFPFVPDLAGGENPALVFTDEERKLSRKFMNVIAHFAKTGSPPDELNWSQYPGYVEIGSSFIPKKEFHAHRMHFWNEVIPKLAYGAEQ